MDINVHQYYELDFHICAGIFNSAAMCGIAVIVQLVNHRSSTDSQVNQQELEQLQHSIAQRGPDAQETLRVEIDQKVELMISAAVLHLRGPVVTKQPIADLNGNILCWNGEIFAGMNPAVGLDENDTLRVLEALARCQDATSIVHFLSTIQGPWAMVYYHASSQILYYGHDKLGRRSLVEGFRIKSEKDATPIKVAHLLSSTTLPYSRDVHDRVQNEVLCTGLYSIDIGSCATTHEILDPVFYPWPETKIQFSVPQCAACPVFQPITSDPVASNHPTLLVQASAFLSVLANAVERRISNIPLQKTGQARVGIFFSGGLDSVVIAALVHFCLPESEEPIDLLNVCFDSNSGYRSPDRLAAETSLRELRRVYPTRTWRLLRMNIRYDEVLTHGPVIQDLVRPCASQMDFNIGTAFWFLSRGRGGVAWNEDQIDVMKVQELNEFLKRSLTSQGSDHHHHDHPVSSSKCPTRTCKRKPKSNCIHRVCHHCCVERYQKENQQENEQELYFCRAHKVGAPAKKEEQMPQDEVQEPLELEMGQRTSAKVMLLGIGADEQLAGYARHKTSYLKNGKQGLRQELRRDMKRIWERNLGRDDRCISAHGREARFPFLDEQVVAFLEHCDLDDIADLDAERGLGDKLILRVIGRHLGLESSTYLAKRAIQFGTRIAKYSNRHSFGSNRKAKGTSQMVTCE